MESVACSRISAIRFHSRDVRSPSVRVFAVRLTNNLCKTRAAMNLNSKSSNTVAASVQLIESSELSHFDNTLPSKGCIISIDLVKFRPICVYDE